MDKEKTDWKIEKERLLGLNLEDRRKEYRRQEFTPLSDIRTWRQECKDNAKVEGNEPTGCSNTSDKVSLHKGDITVLEVDAIVNAANSSLLGGGGVDGCIHKAAGGCLYDECHSLNGCETGKAKITCGYDLPTKYVIHTVGPMARGRAGPSESSDLRSCYQNSLKLLVENNLTTVAFPCISTGIFGFPNKSAADTALKTVKSWIEDYPDKITRVIFCVFLDTDYDIYKEKMAELFQAENDMEVTEEQSKAGNTPPSKKSKNREPSEDGNTDAVADVNDVRMESQNLDEMADDEKPDEAAGEEEEEDDDEGDEGDGEDSNVKEKVEEEPPAANPMEGDPGKPAEEMEDQAEEDGERGTSNAADTGEEKKD